MRYLAGLISVGEVVKIVVFVLVLFVNVLMRFRFDGVVRNVVIFVFNLLIFVVIGNLVVLVKVSLEGVFKVLLLVRIDVSTNVEVIVE